MSGSAPSGAAPRPVGAAYTYLIFLGNNSDLIRCTLQRRPWWSSAIADEDRDGAICTTMPGSLLGGDPRMDYGRHRALAEAALLSGSFDFVWRPTLGLKLSSGRVVTLHSVDPPTPAAAARQLVNHFPAVKCIASKTGLLRGLLDYYHRVGLEPFDNVPTTFVLRDIARRGAADYSAFCAHFRLLAAGEGAAAGERMPLKHCAKNMWLVKPSYLNQGKGIKVVAELTALKETLMTVERAGLMVDGAAVAAGAEWVVQKYVERPLLLQGRKFDIRIWVAVTDAFDVYVYGDGYCRTSSETFTTADVSGKGRARRGGGEHDSAQMVHLTNYCMQKHSKNLGAFEEGNTLSFEQLQTYLDAAYGPGLVSVRGDLLPRWREGILDSLLANRDKLVVGARGRRYFELFGYDFMVDEDWRSWLIEVNTNPYIDKQNPWHHRLLCRMSEDLIRLCIDPLFPPPTAGGEVARGAARPPTVLPFNATSPAAAAALAACRDGSILSVHSPQLAAAAAAPGYLPLRPVVFSHAFRYALGWKPRSLRRAGDGGGGVEAAGSRGGGEGPPDGDRGGQGVEAAPVGVEGAVSEASAAAVSGASCGAGSGAAASTAAAAPVRGNAAWCWPDEGGPPECAPGVPGTPHYRDARVNGWELLYSEHPGVPPLAIPHQAAMAARGAVNAAAVTACDARFGGDCTRMTLADVVACGLPMSSASYIPGVCADETVADGAPSTDAAPAPVSLGPFVRRFVAKRDKAWLYPLGGPCEEVLGPLAGPAVEKHRAGGNASAGSAAGSGADAAETWSRPTSAGGSGSRELETRFRRLRAAAMATRRAGAASKPVQPGEGGIELRKALAPVATAPRPRTERCAGVTLPPRHSAAVPRQPVGGGADAKSGDSDDGGCSSGSMRSTAEAGGGEGPALGSCSLAPRAPTAAATRMSAHALSPTAALRGASSAAVRGPVRRSREFRLPGVERGGRQPRAGAGDGDDKGAAGEVGARAEADCRASDGSECEGDGAGLPTDPGAIYNAGRPGCGGRTRSARRVERGPQRARPGSAKEPVRSGPHRSRTSAGAPMPPLSGGDAAPPPLRSARAVVPGHTPDPFGFVAAFKPQEQVLWALTQLLALLRIYSLPTACPAPADACSESTLVAGSQAPSANPLAAGSPCCLPLELCGEGGGRLSAGEVAVCAVLTPPAAAPSGVAPCEGAVGGAACLAVHALLREHAAPCPDTLTAAASVPDALRPLAGSIPAHRRVFGAALQHLSRAMGAEPEASLSRALLSPAAGSTVLAPSIASKPHVVWMQPHSNPAALAVACGLIPVLWPLLVGLSASEAIEDDAIDAVQPAPSGSSDASAPLPVSFASDGDAAGDTAVGKLRRLLRATGVSLLQPCPRAVAHAAECMRLGLAALRRDSTLRAVAPVPHQFDLLAALCPPSLAVWQQDCRSPSAASEAVGDRFAPSSPVAPVLGHDAGVRSAPGVSDKAAPVLTLANILPVSCRGGTPDVANALALAASGAETLVPSAALLRLFTYPMNAALAGSAANPAASETACRPASVARVAGAQLGGILRDPVVRTLQRAWARAGSEHPATILLQAAAARLLCHAIQPSAPVAVLHAAPEDCIDGPCAAGADTGDEPLPSASGAARRNNFRASSRLPPTPASPLAAAGRASARRSRDILVEGGLFAVAALHAALADGSRGARAASEQPPRSAGLSFSTLARESRKALRELLSQASALEARASLLGASAALLAATRTAPTSQSVDTLSWPPDFFLRLAASAPAAPHRDCPFWTMACGQRLGLASGVPLAPRHMALEASPATLCALESTPPCLQPAAALTQSPLLFRTPVGLALAAAAVARDWLMKSGTGHAVPVGAAARASGVVAPEVSPRATDGSGATRLWEHKPGFLKYERQESMAEGLTDGGGASDGGVCLERSSHRLTAGLPRGRWGTREPRAVIDAASAADRRVRAASAVDSAPSEKPLSSGGSIIAARGHRGHPSRSSPALGAAAQPSFATADGGVMSDSDATLSLRVRRGGRPIDHACGHGTGHPGLLSTSGNDRAAGRTDAGIADASRLPRRTRSAGVPRMRRRVLSRLEEADGDDGSPRRGAAGGSSDDAGGDGVEGCGEPRVEGGETGVATEAGVAERDAAAARSEWLRRKAEQTRLEKARADAERAAAEEEQAARARVRAERVAEARKRLAAARAQQAQRQALQLQAAAQRAREAASEARWRAEAARVREAGWVGLSASAAGSGSTSVSALVSNYASAAAEIACDAPTGSQATISEARAVTASATSTSQGTVYTYAHSTAAAGFGAAVNHAAPPTGLPTGGAGAVCEPLEVVPVGIVVAGLAISVTKPGGASVGTHQLAMPAGSAREAVLAGRAAVAVSAVGTSSLAAAGSGPTPRDTSK